MVQGHAARRIDDLPQLWEGLAKLVREGCGITAFGVQILDLPPDYTTTAHDESETGQEELYVALRGSGAVVLADGQQLPLDADHLVAIAPGTSRALASGADGLRVICVGATPGRPYEVQDWTRGEAVGA